MCVCVITCHADEVYGTTPETAKPFPANMWFLQKLDGVPSEVYFTYTHTGDTPGLWGSAPSDPSNPNLGKQIYVYLCNGGQEAFQITEGSDSYVLFPNKEYLVKITPKVAGIFCMGGAMALKPDWEGKYKYYPIDVTANPGAFRTVSPGETKWFKYKANYPAQLTANNFLTGPIMDFTSIEAIHIECPGGTNIGSGLIPPYLKAGENVIGFTLPSTATADASFSIGLNAMGALSCNNNLLRGSSLEVGKKASYPDAYYTVDRFFNVPEDGTYTIINHGAKGTILNVGSIKMTDPSNEYKYECDWSNIKYATVGNEDAKIVVENLKAGEKIVIQSDAFGVIGEGMTNQPYLLVEKGGQSGISDITADNNTLVANVSAGKLKVSSTLLAQGAEVAVYDMLARKVASSASPVGAETLEIDLDVNAGVYIVVIYGKGNSESAKIVVK